MNLENKIGKKIKIRKPTYILALLRLWQAI